MHLNFIIRTILRPKFRRLKHPLMVGRKKGKPVTQVVTEVNRQPL